ncbi:hypothetical protein K7432_000168 [Basidiobolus ranarum]|uniref:RING-type E3 ubiquitin transferase n=1 Tax=Basidiobolus ranarum TaxID=34480 RepID=A0ABR2WBS6_9FUNG
MSNGTFDVLSARIRSIFSFTPREHPEVTNHEEGRNFSLPETADLSLSQALYFGPHFALIDENATESSGTTRGEASVGTQANETSVGSSTTEPLNGTGGRDSSCTVFRSSINLKIPTLSLIKTDFHDEEGLVGNKYNIEFTFDSLYPCKIKLYWCAQEVWGNEDTSVGYKLKYPSQTIPTFNFQSGLNQKFYLPNDQLLDIHKFQPGDLVLNIPKNEYSPKPENDQNTEDEVGFELKEPTLDSIIIQDDTSSTHRSSLCYPLIIVLETITTGDKVPDTLSTFISLTVNSEGTYDIQTLKQKVKINGISFVLQEIYGFSESQSHQDTLQTNEDDPSSARECVICMSDLRDTTVLPCRHMCLCKECAEVLRCQSSKCPICRQPFHSLLYIGSSNTV